MGTLRRRSQIVASTTSLLVCALLILLWYRSHHGSDWITYSSGNGVYHEYVTLPGQFRYTRVSGYPAAQPFEWRRNPFPPLRPVFGQQPVYRTWAIVGVGFDGGSRRINSPAAAPGVYAPVTVNYQITAVPFAVPAFLAAAVGLLPWVRRRRRVRQAHVRRKQGLCETCGYDVRESKDRCPECGSPVASPNEKGEPEGPPSAVWFKT
jgi:hypothetical protein